MANLRAALVKHFSHPDSELSPSSLAAKRNFGIDILFAELRSMGTARRAPAVHTKRVHSLPAPMLPKTSSIDAENRKRLLEIGRTVYSDKSFQASIENPLLQQRAKSITETIKRDGGLDARPGATPDPLSVACDASTADEHRKAAEVHRALARKAKTLDAGVAHFKAGDAHDLAAQSGDANDSSRARAASRLLRKAS